jgi:iron complex transport system substrate-binding protein
MTSAISAKPMRICSLLPSATEILYALGLGDCVVGVTHECDFPPEAARKPFLIRPRVDPKSSPADTDRLVAEIIARGESIYSVDAELLASLSPDLIVTQDLCHVCAASPDDLASALTRFEKRPEVLSLTPRSLAEVWANVRSVGEATGRQREAEALADSLDQRVAAIEATARRASSRPRVLCLEWLDPYYVGGHWVPEMVAKAGGRDVLGREREPSYRVTPEEIVAARPEVIVVMPCGYDVARTAAEFRQMHIPEAWKDLSAVRNDAIFAVDANNYFSRPGPRLADGIAILAQILHPELFPEEAASQQYSRLL